MERTDHCLIVGPGAYRFARDHGHPHTELLTDEARQDLLRWRESMSERDDRLPPRANEGEKRAGRSSAATPGRRSPWRPPLGRAHHRHHPLLGARQDRGRRVHDDDLGARVEDPGASRRLTIIGAGLYCDQEVGSAGGTGRGESAILANASFAAVELMRHGRAPADAPPGGARARQAAGGASRVAARARSRGRPAELRPPALCRGSRGAHRGDEPSRPRELRRRGPRENGPRHEPLVGV